MNFTPTTALFTFLSIALAACSGSDDTGSTGGSTSSKTSGTESGSSSGGTTKKPAGTSESSDTTESTEKSCSSASLNGRCTEGSNKGKACCYAPESEDDAPCAQSNQCDVVCEYCK